MTYYLKLLLILGVLIPSFAISQQKAKDTIKVFYLGGQSNMDGYGYNSDLPPSLNKEFKDVFIFHGNSVPDEQENGGLGKWETLKPGHGTDFTLNSDKNKLSNRFGIELSFAKKLQELYPNQKFAFIKYSRGGTSIDTLAAGPFGSWDVDYKGTNGINQYDHFLTTLQTALSTNDIDGDGKEDLLIPSGILWMQGESDAAYTEQIANNYYNHLKRLMDLMRANFHSDDLPVVIGKISDSWNDKDGKVWDYGELVQYAQEKYVKTDKNAAIVRSTRYYKYSDRWHYDSEGYIDLGEKFAEAIFHLQKK
ncbi:sialate O-acetylesterase [Sediminibacter sp. Hel_I_10]|uniref:sialate O-acetylesterase n=1 Tax=Sediminibacter sp. Hel_I_10 TaxID=1392490 RepID=UPI00047D89B6|nr:sialate O-acetylesterase [Sediminibacter sp. Hel_I_10]